MSLYGGRGHDVRRRGGSAGGQHQLAVVAGYQWESKALQAHVYLACGMVPSGLLRYAGRTTIEFSTEAEKRAFARQMHAMRLAAHHPLIASPLPAHMVCVAPRLLADVSHQGWTSGGLMHDIHIQAFRTVDEPSPPTREGPTIKGA